MIVVSLLLIGVAVVLLVLGLWQPSSALLTGSIGASLLAAVVLVIGARQSAAARAGADPADAESGHRHEPRHRPRHAEGRAHDDAHPSHEPEAPATAGPAGGEEQEPRSMMVAVPVSPPRAGSPGNAEPSYGSAGTSDESLPAAATGTVIESTTGAEADSGSDAVPVTDQGVPEAATPEDATATRAAGPAMPAMIIPQQSQSVVDLAGTPVADPASAANGQQEELPAEQVLEDVDPPDEPAVQQVSSADAERVGQMDTEVLVVDGRPRYHLAGCVHLLGRESEPLPVSEAVELGFTPCSLCEPDSALLADARRV